MMRRKKGGQRLLDISRSGVGRRAVNARRKAATKKKSTAAEAKAKIESLRKRLGIKAKPKTTPKSTAASRNRTALRTPKGAGSVAKNKPVAKKPVTPKKTPASRPRSVMRADNPTFMERVRRFGEKLFPETMGMEPYAPSMGDAGLEIGKRYLGSRVAGGGLSAARNPKKALTAVSGVASKMGSAAKDVAKSVTARTRRRPMPKVSADKAQEGVKRQQQRVDPVGKQVTTPKPRNKKAADQKNLERQQRAGVKGARSKAAKKVLKEAENKKPAKKVSKEVLSKASSKSGGPKYRSTARPSGKTPTLPETVKPKVGTRGLGKSSRRKTRKKKK